MGKRILVGVANCVYSEQVVKYAARISSAVTNITYTLFNVQSLIPRILIERREVDREIKAEVDELVRESAQATRYAIDGFKDLMVQEGIPDNRIEVITEPMHEGMAKDILNRAEQGLYDAVVLGRRGLTPSRDSFVGATAAKVVEHALKIPVWIISGEATSKKILLPVDGSETSTRVVDHVINMVGANPDVRLTMFHVPLRLQHCYCVIATGRTYDIPREKPHLQKALQDDDRRRMDDFYERAYQRFEAAGLKKGQIDIKSSTWSYDISTAILDEVTTAQYGTLVIGRRGREKAFFAGRIAMRLLQKVSDQALWVVP
jgi:nucleotide-binding universal stress UspA family protein